MLPFFVVVTVMMTQSETKEAFDKESKNFKTHSTCRKICNQHSAVLDDGEC